MSRKCKTVSFDLLDKHEVELMEYAENQGKFSRYVKRLINDDMNKKLENKNDNDNSNNGTSEDKKDNYTLEAMNGFV